MSLTSLAPLLTPLSSILSFKTILASWHHPSSQVVSTPPPQPQAETSTPLFSISAADDDTDLPRSRTLCTIPASGLH